MNGMAASDKIFRLLDLPEREEKTEEAPAERSRSARSGSPTSPIGEILHGVDMTFAPGSLRPLWESPAAANQPWRPCSPGAMQAMGAA